MCKLQCVRNISFKKMLSIFFAPLVLTDKKSFSLYFSFWLFYIFRVKILWQLTFIVLLFSVFVLSMEKSVRILITKFIYVILLKIFPQLKILLLFLSFFLSLLLPFAVSLFIRIKIKKYIYTSWSRMHALSFNEAVAIHEFAQKSW